MSTNQPLVSIVIPCFKQSKFLQTAIDSVIAQTYSHWQVMVVDDGSPDDPQTAMEPYAGDSRISFVTQSHEGVASARNRGVAMSSGQYLQFLDADDWLHPDKIATQVTILEGDASAGMCYCDYYLALGDTTLSAEHTVTSRCADPFAPDLFNNWWIQGVFPPCAVLLRREWFDRAGGFSSGITLFEDYELWMRMSCLGCRVRFVPQRLAYYRQHNESLTSDQQAVRKGLILVRSTIARQFPDRIGAATDYLVHHYERLVAEMQLEIAQLRQGLSNEGEGSLP